MKKALVDVSVLLIFFTRSEQFRQVFEQVQKARPKELFLSQDGPRADHPEDGEKIARCREIAEDIDWECQVHRLYQEKNMGVDPSGYLADVWAFSQTDKCIVLEDDVVPAVSFFSFCKELLDRYEHDEEVMLISGFNVEEKTEGVRADYFFSSTTFTWGWASWSRVVRDWDPAYEFLQDARKRTEVQTYIKEKKLVKNMLHVFEQHLDSGIEHFETLLIANQYLHRGLTIVPTKNMVINIGVTSDSAHYADDMELLARGLRRIFTMPFYELPCGELKHPRQKSDFTGYREHAYRIYGWGHPFVKLYRLLETSFYQLKRGNIRGALRDVTEKAGKVLSRTSS